MNRGKLLIIGAVLLLAAGGGGMVAGQSAAARRADIALREERSVAEMGELFHDQGYLYISNMEPTATDSVTLRLRTEHYNVTKAAIQYTLDEGATWESVPMTFDKTDRTGYYDYWIGTVPPQSTTYYYRFVAENNGEKSTTYVGTQTTSPVTLDLTDMFCVIPGYSTPDWAKGTLWYSLDTDAFYNADPLNDFSDTDKRKTVAWGNSLPGLYERYGGDLQGVVEKLDYLKGLGVESVYLNPIWKSSVSIGYGPADDNEISPYLGNDQTLLSLINSLHGNDMRIMLDAVLSYRALESKWFNESHLFPLDGAAQDADNPFAKLFYFYQWPMSYRVAWGNAGINFSSETTKKLIYQDKDSFLQRYLREPYNIDGWRFDAVEYFWGTDDDQHTIAADMKNYLKSINKDALFMREEYVESSLFKGIWESAWGNKFLQSSRKWFAQTITQSELVTALNSNYHLPRALGLSIYNHIGQHDWVRLFDDPVKQLTQIQAAQILLMTYIGAPCIYFGEEIGVANNADYIGVSQRWNNFNWDESTWNYDIYNLMRALGQLRKEYSALRTGVQKTGLVDDARQLIVMGRWDENGSVISLLNQSAVAQTLTVDVKQFNVRDGEVLIDYLSGAQYTVKDGRIDAAFLPGGSVLVTGKQAGGYRGSYAINKLGGSGTVVKTGTDTFELNGKGQVTGRSDKLYLADAPLFGNGTLTAKAEGGGSAVLTMRADETADAAAYSVVIARGEATAYVRGAAGNKSVKLAAVPVAEGQYVRIARENGNVFALYTSDDGAASGWTKAEGAEAAVEMPETVYAGFAPLKGSLKLSGAALVRMVGQFSESFDGDILGSMLTGSLSKDAQASLADGRLTVRPAGGQGEFLALTPAGDWTIKTQLAFTPAGEGDMAGVISRADDSAAVVAVRTMADGVPALVLGKLQNDKLVVYASVKDTRPTEPVTLQLQRVGTQYSAVYSYDGSRYDMLGTGLFANFSVSRAGLCAAGKAEASFDYVCFGDAVTDGASYNTPRYPSDIDMDFSSMNAVQVWEDMRVYNDKGDWTYDVGGVRRTDSAGLSQIVIDNKVFGDFRAEATLTVEGSGTAGFSFGRDKLSDTLDGGYTLAVTKDGKLTLSRDDSILLSKDVTMPDGGLRVVVERVGSAIYVYAGQQGDYLGSVSDSVYGEGYVAFYTENTPGTVANYTVNNLKSPWTDVLGAYNPAFQGENGNVTVTTNDRSLANVEGVGVTDVLVKFRVQLNPAKQAAASTTTVQPEVKAYAGVLVGASQGYLPDRQGVLLTLNEDGRVSLSVLDKEVDGVTLDGGAQSADLMLTVKNGKYLVYINGSDQPALSYQAPVAAGGTVSLMSFNSKGFFYGLAAEDLTNVDDPTSLAAFRSFAGTSAAPVYASGTVTESFDGGASATKNWMSVSGMWTVADGVLSYPNNRDQWTKYNLVTARFNDFTASFRMRFDSADDSGFAGFSFGKTYPRDQYVDSGYFLAIGNDGSVKLYNSAKSAYSTTVGYIPGFDAGSRSWLNVTLRKNGPVITAYVNGAQIWQITDDTFGGGYVALHASQTRASFDDVTIQPSR